MLLPGVLIAAFLTGWWLFCLIQAAFTPAREFPGLRKDVWVALIAATFILGAAAWVIRAESRRAQLWLLTPAAHPALRRRPGAPIGPDDDPEFLELLGRRIRGTYETGELRPAELVRLRPSAESKPWPPPSAVTTESSPALAQVSISFVPCSLSRRI